MARRNASQKVPVSELRAQLLYVACKYARAFQIARFKGIEPAEETFTMALAQTPEEVADRVRLALKHIPAARLWLVPDCGLWETPRWVGISKLRSMVEAARTIRRELGVALDEGGAGNALAVIGLRKALDRGSIVDIEMFCQPFDIAPRNLHALVH